MAMPKCIAGKRCVADTKCKNGCEFAVSYALQAVAERLRDKDAELRREIADRRGES